jgi:hypothetical protein
VSPSDQSESGVHGLDDARRFFRGLVLAVAVGALCWLSLGLALIKKLY